jgi:hypothetical protein
MRATIGSARTRWAVALVAMLATAVLGTGTASASHPPYSFVDRCPVDDPLFTQPDPGGGFANSICVASNSTNGTFRLGKRTVETGNSNLQFGLHFDDSTPNEFQVFGGSLRSAPAYPPGGLLNIRLPDSPESNPLQRLKELVNGTVFEGPGSVLGVRSRVVLAGEPSNFDLAAGLSPNSGPVIHLPVLIRLEHPLLGRNCRIGSRQNPIVLKPQTLTVGELSFVEDPVDPDKVAIRSLGGSQGDDSFAVPRATNCGPAGVLTPIVNSQLGLPLKPGESEITLLNGAVSLVGSNTGDMAGFVARFHDHG